MKTIRALVARTAVLSAVVGTAVAVSAGTATATPASPAGATPASPAAATPASPAAATPASPAAAAGYPPAVVAGDWAAIAISVRTGNVAYAHGYASAGAASGSAVSRCNAYDCRAVVQVSNGCAAVAQAPNRAWGWGYAASRAGAERQAVSGAPGRGARVIAYVCASNHA